ncbi:MAG: hypothetical protein LWW86_04505 [Micrococcales bacterium]|nr:hypothetical protein [Micrococcales bacterium]
MRAPATTWPQRHVRWPDFGLPLRRSHAWAAFAEAHWRSATQRVEIACAGGVGRTGTALAALAMLDGLGPDEAITWVRERYHAGAVETPWQRWWLRLGP